MQILKACVSTVFVIFFVVGIVCAQDDEARQASGLPLLVGENSSNRSRAPLSGKLTIQGYNVPQTKPVFFVVVYYSGALFDKRQVNDAGYYYMPGVPRENAILAVEADGIEVGRFNLPSSVMGSIKQDIEIPWIQLQDTKITKTGVLSAKNYYPRTKGNEMVFNKAILLAKNKNKEAVKLFQQLLKNDAKDYAAWTELGTLFFNDEKFAEAEDAYSRALAQKNDFLLALLNLGKLYLVRKDTDKAIEVLTKAVEMEASSSNAQHYLGEAYLQAKKGSKAVVFLNEALKLAPIEKAEIHLRLASLYNGAGLKDKAVAEYKMFLEKNPNYKEKEKIEKYIRENLPQ